MNVVAERWSFIDCLHDLAREIIWMRGGKAHAANTVHRGDFSQQLDEIQLARAGIAIGIHCLAEKLDFAIAQIYEALDFSENRLAAAAAFGAARVRDHAIGAGV